MTNKFRENVKRSTVVRSAKEAKNGKCKTSEMVFMVLRSGKSNHFFSALKIGNLARAGTESLWRKVWTAQNYAEFFPLLTRAVQTFPSGFFFSGLTRSNGVFVIPLFELEDFRYSFPLFLFP